MFFICPSSIILLELYGSSKKKLLDCHLFSFFQLYLCLQFLDVFFPCYLCVCGFRYDGQRAQIHKLSDGSFRVFSRNGDESTSRFPDLINIIKESCNPNAEAFILDAEVRTSLKDLCT